MVIVDTRATKGVMATVTRAVGGKKGKGGKNNGDGKNIE